MFSSRASLDALLHPPKREVDESTDVLLMGFDDGTIHLSINDVFEIGTFSTRQITPQIGQSRMIRECSHPYSSTHALLIQSLSVNVSELHFVPFDLRLIPETGKYLSLLASKSTQLHNLLRYIQEVQNQIYSEFRASQDLPQRFMRNIEETLQEKSQTSFVTAAYQLVATGICGALMKEWLVDELGDRVCEYSASCLQPMANTKARVTNAGIRLLRPGMKMFDDLHTRPFSLLWNVLGSSLVGFEAFQDSTNLQMVLDSPHKSSIRSLTLSTAYSCLGTRS